MIEEIKKILRYWDGYDIDGQTKEEKYDYMTDKIREALTPKGDDEGLLTPEEIDVIEKEWNNAHSKGDCSLSLNDRLLKAQRDLTRQERLDREKLREKLIPMVCSVLCVECQGSKCKWIQGDWAFGEANKILVALFDEKGE